MPNNLTTNFGKVVVDTSLIPYIRSRDVEFTARNLKPYKLSKIFFDDIAVNAFCQVGNKVILDAKKLITVSRNNSTTIAASDIAYQGTSNTVNTFNAIVDAWYVSNSTVVLRSLSGNFDEEAQLFIEAATSHDGLTIGNTFANCNVNTVITFNTSDTFLPGEGVRCPQGGNVYAKVLATSGENVLYLNQNFVTLNVTANGSDVLTNLTQDYKPGDIVYQTPDGSQSYYSATFRGKVEYYNVQSPGTLAIKPIAGDVLCNATSTSANANVRFWNASNTASKAICAQSFNTNKFESGNLVSASNTSNTIKIISYTHRSGVLANTLNPNTSSIILSVDDASNHPSLNANLVYFTSGTGVGEVKRIVNISGREATLNSALTVGYDSATHYTIGNFIVDEYGTQTGIFHIPSFPGYKFKTGNRLLTITDTNTYNDPDYGMRAVATYAASGLLKTTQNIQTTPTLPPFPEVDADNLVAPINPAERSYSSTGSKSPITGSTASSTPRIPLGDGLSQTFFTPKPTSNKQDYGIFATSVDLFFRSKPSVALGSMQLPVTVKIAEVSNGYPTKKYLAAKTIQAKDVKTSSIPSTTDASTATKFTFDDPVYLEPNREYALIVGSDSPDYELFIAELGQEVLGSAQPRRISEQPYAGSLFRSQNSSTWTAYQNQDLMFVINKAVFESSGTATFNLEEAPPSVTGVDKFILASADLRFPVGSVDYRVRGIYSIDSTNDTGVLATPYSTIEYGVLQDKSSAVSSNRRKLARGNANSFVTTVEMSSSDPDVSPVVNLERLALTTFLYNINNAGISNNYVSISNKGSGYSNTGPANTSAAYMAGNSYNLVIGSSNTTLNNFAQLYRETYYPYPTYNVGFYNLTITSGFIFVGTNNGDYSYQPETGGYLFVGAGNGDYTASENNIGSGATGFAIANTDGLNTVNHIVMMTPGSGYLETPSATIASGANTVSNTLAFVTVSGETSKSGGNIRAKYITREIVLEDGFESGDIRVYMDAIRPSPVDIQVYYKVLSGDDVDRISDKTWRRMEKMKDIYSRNARTLIGLEFRPSISESKISYTENGISYPIGGKFKRFQIKVCLLSPDPSLVPKIRNLRIIATPEG